MRGPAASDLLVRLMGREGWEDPYAIHRDARRQGPVAWSELGVAMVTGHAECSAVLKGAGWLADPRRNPVMPAELAEQDVSLLSLDPPDHTRLRKLVSSSFSARAIDRLSQVAQSYAQQLVKAAVQEGDVDVMSALAYPLPLAVICHLLGVPDEDRSRIGRWGYDLSPGLDLALSGPPPDSVVAASACVDDYFRGLIARKRKQPSGDFVGQLLEAQRNGAEIGDRELLNLCTLILLAGFVTTVNLIGNGLSSLLAHPDQWQECLSDPGLLGNAVEEMLRFESPVQYTARFPSPTRHSRGRTSAPDAMPFSCSVPPTETRPSSQTPTSSTSLAPTPTSTSPSLPGSTTASALPSPDWKHARCSLPSSSKHPARD